MMNNEDFKQKMTFIVNQQAQFAVDIEKLYAAQRRTEQTLSETNEVVNRLAYVTNFGFKDVNAKIDALVDSQIRTDDMIKELRESQKETEHSIKQLTESQKETEHSIKQLTESQKETAKSINRLTSSQEKTDEKFRKLIDRLDRRSNNGGNTS